MELVLQGVQTVSITGAGAKLGDVEAGGVRHVDHESVGEDHQVVLLRKTKTFSFTVTRFILLLELFHDAFTNKMRAPKL